MVAENEKPVSKRMMYAWKELATRLLKPTRIMHRIRSSKRYILENLKT